MNTVDTDTIQNAIIEEFEPLDDWMDRYALIIEMGKDLKTPDDSQKTIDHLIAGCQSRVWIVSREEGGRLYFKADSDALIVKGIAAILMRIFDGQTAEDILKADPFFIDKLGLREHLSPTRSNGLFSMIEKVKQYAAETLAKQA